MLLADSHTLVREGLRKVVVEADFEVVGKVGEGDALVRETLRLSPDLVGDELRLPGLGGVEAARRIRSRHPDARIVFLAAIEHGALAAQAFAAGRRATC